MANKLYETALYWRDCGVSAIPIFPMQKIPMFHWGRWCNELPGDNELKLWFKDPKYNLAIICGGRSRICVLDFDVLPQYYNWLSDMKKRKDEWSEVATRSYTVKTARGRHVYVKFPDGTHSMKAKEYGADIRAFGNYVLAPPSIHPSGKIYEAINEINILEAPPIDGIFTELIDSDCKKEYRKREVKREYISDYDNELEQGSIKDIKDSIGILDYVSRYSDPKRSDPNGRWYYARCISPTHNDHHPSFRIDTATNRARCLTPSCILYSTMGLDVVDLHMRINSCDIRTAIQELKCHQ
jgi:hypothetical protein